MYSDLCRIFQILTTKTTILAVAAPGLGTEECCVRYATFFCILLKNAAFFFAFFSNFRQLMKAKRTLRSFAFFLKECAFFKKNAHSFKKNATFFKRKRILFKRMRDARSVKDRCVLFKRTRGL